MHTFFRFGLVASLSVSPLLAAQFETSRSGTGGEVVLPAGGDILYTQLDDPSGISFTDQLFEPFYHWYDSEGADDFVVDAATGWDVGTLITPGAEQATGGGTTPNPIQFVNVAFYEHGGNRPGLPLADCQFPVTTQFVDDEGGLTIDVDCSLAPGHYWFSQQVRMDGGPGFSQHFWSTRLSARNQPAAWRNPAGEFVYNCMDWKPANAFCGMPGKDYLFELRGAVSAPGPVPVVGPPGLLALLLSLGAGSAYLLRRRD